MKHEQISQFEQQFRKYLQAITTVDNEDCTLSEQDISVCLSAVAATLQAHDEMRILLHDARQKNHNHKALYEGILQTYLFAGFPAALEGLAILHEVFPEEKIHKQPFDEDAFSKRGKQLCKTIYTSAYEKMRQRLAPIAPDLDAWMILEGYGKTLSRDGLTVQVRELSIVSVLAATGWKNQLFSHIRGSLNVGCSQSDIRAIIDALDIFGGKVSQQLIDDARNIMGKVVRTMSS